MMPPSGVSSFSSHRPTSSTNPSRSQTAGDAFGPFLGIRHGAYCVGCCWRLMALLLVGGAMNVLWIVLLALLIVLEEVTPSGRLIAHLAGIVLLSGGAWLLATGIS